MVRVSSSDTIPQFCTNQLAVNNKFVRYCNKATEIVSKSETSSFVSTGKSPIYYGVYTSRVQDFKLNLSYSLTALPSFSLFSTSAIQIQGSDLFVDVPDDTSQVALICFYCEIQIKLSNLALIASGYNVSGVCLTSAALSLDSCLVQSRLLGIQLSSLILFQNASISLIKSNISAHMQGQGGFLAFESNNSDINLQTAYFCSSSPQIFSGTANIQGSLIQGCEFCINFAYGLCLTQMQYTELKNEQLQCKNGFAFNGKWCECSGSIVNSECVDIILTTQNILLKQNELKIQYSELNQRIINNISNLNQSTQNALIKVNDTISKLSFTIQSMNGVISDQNQIIAQQLQMIQNESIINVLNLTQTHVVFKNFSASNAQISNIYNKSQIDTFITNNISQLTFKPRKVGEVIQTFTYQGQTFNRQSQTYVLCAGQSTQISFPKLYAIGLTVIPNMEDTFLKGTTNPMMSNDQNFYGANSRVLTIDQMPAHTHTSRGYSSTAGYGGWEITGEGTAYDYPTSSAGGNQPIDTKPRHRVVYYYIVTD
ncbi:Hypothetical_protein [Hexamita inflata]|uniref:Hypothetical_protein n=1 Tax=Hexamita inflata TaxID=28002 RepID=A0AA86PDV4_9EUKA|nr:Hypothetical protein HINF_LOCUS24874 [Hexamita inflata]CAI9953955.1 Hypothetical protein HINF_LOCUS41600 [Hexamita inflata]